MTKFLRTFFFYLCIHKADEAFMDAMTGKPDAGRRYAKWMKRAMLLSKGRAL